MGVPQILVLKFIIKMFEKFSLKLRNNSTYKLKMKHILLSTSF